MGTTDGWRGGEGGCGEAGIYIKAAQFVASLQGGAGDHGIPKEYVRVLQVITPTTSAFVCSPCGGLHVRRERVRRCASFKGRSAPRRDT